MPAKQLNIIDDLLRVADPNAMAASPDLVPAMIGGGNRNSFSGTGDMRPMVYRAGSQRSKQTPAVASLDRKG